MARLKLHADPALRLGGQFEYSSALPGARRRLPKPRRRGGLPRGGGSTAEELEALLAKIITRTMRILTRLGALIEEPDQTYLAETDTIGALRALQAASCTYRIALGPRAGQKVLSLQRLPSAVTASIPELRVNAHGFSLHAAVRWRADQRKELEQLCRYITRPAIANERLKHNRAGQVLLQLKSPYKDGTTHIVMEPLEFMERLAALVPRPRLHLIRFHGVLAPNAKLRSQIVPAPAERATETSKRRRSGAGRAGAHELGTAAQTGLRHRHRKLPELRRRIEDHRRHRRSAGDRQDPQPSGPADPRPAGAPARRVDLFQTI